MGAKLKAIFVFLFLSAVFLHSFSAVFAFSSCDLQLSSAGPDGIFTTPTERVLLSSINVTNDNQQPFSSSDGTYFIEVGIAGKSGGQALPLNITNGKFGPIDITDAVSGVIENNFEIRVERNLSPTQRETTCRVGLRVSNAANSCNSPQIKLTRTGTEIVNVGITMDGTAVKPGDTTFIAYFRLANVAGDTARVPLQQSGSSYMNGFSGHLNPGAYTLAISTSPDLQVTDLTNLSLITPPGYTNCLTGFTIPNPITTLPNSTDPGNGGFCPAGQICDGSQNQSTFVLCEQAANAADKAECRKCITGSSSGPSDITDAAAQGYWTAFGCVKTSKEGIVTSLIRIGIGISGGFVLLSILYGSFLITTSSGDPKRVQEGQEMVTSAVMGLIFVIFSIIILRFIGVSILQIPGFGGT